MYRTKKGISIQTVYPCSGGRFFASFNTCGKTRFLGTFDTKKDATSAVKRALKGRSPKKLVCYY